MTTLAEALRQCYSGDMPLHETWDQDALGILGDLSTPPAAPLDRPLQNDEELGYALHRTFHPGHPWSGCANPDRVYEWNVTFRAALGVGAESSKEAQ